MVEFSTDLEVLFMHFVKQTFHNTFQTAHSDEITTLKLKTKRIVVSKQTCKHHREANIHQNSKIKQMSLMNSNSNREKSSIRRG